MTSAHDPHAAARDMTRREIAYELAAEHNATASQWHVAPASLLILAFIGGGLAPGSANTWIWICALAINVIARLLIPNEERSRAMRLRQRPGPACRAPCPRRVGARCRT